MEWMWEPASWTQAIVTGAVCGAVVVLIRRLVKGRW